MQGLSKKEQYALIRKRQDLFSRIVLGVPLYRYQLKFSQYILDVVRDHRDEVIVVEMPRQSGKNEASAHIELNLLAQCRTTGGSIVKAAPTFRPQVVTSKNRFTKLANNAMQKHSWMRFTPAEGYIFRNGAAEIAFFSADKKSNVVGATASLLLELDESQDISMEKYSKDFTPMRASTAAPVVVYGTTWTDDTLLEVLKQQVLEGKTPGRVFRITPDEIARENPAYGEFVQQQIALLGREHPAVKTQYFLEMLKNQGRMLNKQQLIQMIGRHERKETRTDENIIVAGLDFAGADEDAGQIASMAKMSARDSVALTVATVRWTPVIAGVMEPEIRILARYEWVNVHPLSLHSTLHALLNDTWKVNRLHTDGTGIGATGSMMLAKSLDNNSNTRVFIKSFDAAWKLQTELASQYISMVNGTRLIDYRSVPDVLKPAFSDTPPTNDVDLHVWWQRGHARLMARESKRLHAYVPKSEGHDDLLMSEMLCVDAGIALGSVGLVSQRKRTAIGV